MFSLFFLNMNTLVSLPNTLH